MLELQQVVADVADALVAIDRSAVPFKAFQPGVGPYGEPQLVRAVAEQLNERASYKSLVATKRTPDLLIRGHWALEIKLARPFGTTASRRRTGRSTSSILIRAT